jgi:hypothetical protein
MVMEQAFKEITIWADGATTVNHTYLLNGDKAVAYIRYGTSEPFWFKTPIKLDKRGRKFEQVDSILFHSSFNVFTPNNIKEVLGSKGTKYIVLSQTTTKKMLAILSKALLILVIILPTVRRTKLTKIYLPDPKQCG